MLFPLCTLYKQNNINININKFRTHAVSALTEKTRLSPASRSVAN